MSNPTTDKISSTVGFTRRGAGAPVILIHGLAASLYDWDFLIPELVKAGFEACALDLLGHGESYKPTCITDYNVEEVIRHLTGWIECLDLHDSAILIGHSLGGYLVLDYALRYPDRVRALVLANPFYSVKQLSPFLQLVFRRQLLNTTLVERTPYWLFRIAVDVSSLHLGGGNDGLHSLPEMVRIQTALDYKRAAPGIYNIPRTMRDLTPDLQRIAVPTLVLWGVHDHTLASASFSELIRNLPNALGEEITSCGHVPHQCHAQGFNRRVMNFLCKF